MYGFWCKSRFCTLSTPARLTLCLQSAIGSMCAPLVCQSILARGIAWNHFYFGSLVLSAISSTLAFFAFQPTRKECDTDVTTILENTSTHAKNTKAPRKPEVNQTSLADEGNSAEVESTISPSCHKLGMFSCLQRYPRLMASIGLGRALRMPAVWAFSIFCGLYTGTYVVSLIMHLS